MSIVVKPWNLVTHKIKWYMAAPNTLSVYHITAYSKVINKDNITTISYFKQKFLSNMFTVFKIKMSQIYNITPNKK